MAVISTPPEDEEESKMTKLNQIIAIEKGTASKVRDEWTAIHHTLQKPALISGISRTYRPKDEDGERLPAESTRVQVQVSDSIEEVHKLLARLINVVATKDKTNTIAKADIKIDGGPTLAVGVPVPQLLWLEKKLTDVVTFVKKLPTLDPSEEWQWDEASNAYRTPVLQTHRTKKIPRAFTKAPATERHPAQVEMFTEDVIVGFWDTIKYSGAATAEQKAEILERVEAVQRAVKYAREEANSQEVEDFKIGDTITDYIFNG